MTTLTHTYPSSLDVPVAVVVRRVDFPEGLPVVDPTALASDTVSSDDPSAALTVDTPTESTVYEVEHVPPFPGGAFPDGYRRRSYFRLDGSESSSVALADLTAYATPEAARAGSSGGSGTGGATASPTPPASPASGDVWINTAEVG